MKVLFYVILFLALSLETIKGEVRELKQCIEEKKKNMICIVSDEYVDNLPPGPDTTINIAINVRDIVDINESKHTLTFLIDFVVWWRDERLSTSNGTEELSLNGPGLDITNYMKDVWVPEVSFTNSVKIEKSKGMKEPSLKKLWFKRFTKTNKWVQFYETFTVEFTCNMQFDLFPFDQQNCTLDALSLNQNVIIDTLYLGVNESFSMLKTVMLDASGQPFDVYANPELTTEATKWSKVEVTFSRAVVNLHLKRNTGQLETLMISFYIPSMAFSTFSKFSFFVKPENVPGRMGMLITIFLVETAIYGSVDAPKFRGFGFIERWYIGVQTPIIFAILEYGFLLMVLKYKDQNAKIKVGGKKTSLEKLMKTIDILSFFLALAYSISFNFYYLNDCFSAKQ